jgi:hypothetical protein
MVVVEEIKEPVRVVDETARFETTDYAPTATPPSNEGTWSFEPTVIQEPIYDKEEPKYGMKWLWAFIGLVAALVVGWVLSQQ